MNRTSQTLRRAPEIFPSLPGTMGRNDWLELIDEVANRLHIGSAARHTLRYMVRATRPSDWTSAEAEPICYMAQGKLAERVGVSASRVRAHQVELERAGIIERRIGGNGARSGFAGCGVVFSPGIALLPALIELRDRARAEAEQAALLRGQRSVHKGILRSLISALIEAGATLDDVTPFTEALQQWPRADALHHMTLAQLAEHVDNVRATCSKAQDLLDAFSDSNGQPLETERCYIQVTTQAPYEVTCNASVEMQREGKPSQTDIHEVRPTGLPCFENECEAASVAHKAEFLDKLSPARLYRLCSAEMQLWLDVARGDRPIERLRLLDLLSAAERRVPELGINASAWIAAVEQMGPELAALCVMILDANRSAPIRVQNPGGYLRAMIARHRAGTLNIIGSLIGLSERRRTEGTIA